MFRLPIFGLPVFRPAEEKKKKERKRKEKKKREEKREGKKSARLDHNVPASGKSGRLIMAQFSQADFRPAPTL